jgi:hypothetical protein
MIMYKYIDMHDTCVSCTVVEIAALALCVWACLSISPNVIFFPFLNNNEFGISDAGLIKTG